VEKDAVVLVLREMKQKGFKLTDVWSKFQERDKEVKSQTTTTPKLYPDCVEEFRVKKLAAGDSKRYVKNTCATLHKFGIGREKQNIHEIPMQDLNAWLTKQGKEKGWSLRTRDTYQTLFSSLWTLSIKNNWAMDNIVTRLESINLPGVEVKIFTYDETMNLMAAVLSSKVTEPIIGPMTFGFFGCMRPEEVESKRAKGEGVPEELWFGWQDVDLKHARVRVRKEIAKKGDERTIRLQPCAVKWLELAKELGLPLYPPNERKLVDQCCDLIDLPDWIRDGMRKTCATHLRAVYKNDHEVTLDCGNSIKVLLESYAALHVPLEVSLKHWKITPALVKAYLTTDAWRKVLADAAKSLLARREAEAKAAEVEAAKVKAEVKAAATTPKP
jgi:hypothetical protein